MRLHAEVVVERERESLFGIAGGGVKGQAAEGNSKLRVLLYYSAHLSLPQQLWPPFEKEFWALLNLRREAVKHFGRIPSLIHTDHANIARVETAPP